MRILVALSFIAVILCGCSTISELGYDTLVNRQIETDKENRNLSDYEKKKNFPSYAEYLEERKAAQEAIKKDKNQ